MNNPVIPPSLTLPRTLVQRLFHHAQGSPDTEICGLISESSAGELQAHRIPNVAAEPARRFSMDEAALARAMREIREADEQLFAIYHSHPSGPAVPSATDLTEAGYPQAWQLIISLNTKGVLELRAWHLVEGEAAEARLRIIED